MNELMALKLRCADLLLDCPLDRHTVNCPFRKLRQEESVVTRVNRIKSADAATLKQMLSFHESCLARPAGIQERHP